MASIGTSKPEVRSTRRRLLMQAAFGAVGAITARLLPAAKRPAAAPSSAHQPATRPSTAPSISPELEAKIRTTEEYLAKLYAEPLKSTERLPREIAVMSLAKIDAPATTQKLLDIFKGKDRDPIVWYLAWEALHIRHKSLTPAERRAWATGGLQAATAGAFPGPTVTPLLRALAEHHPVVYENEPWKLAYRVVRENRLSESAEKEALDALKDLIAAWHDPGFVRYLAANLSKPEVSERIDYVLRGLPSPPSAGDAKKMLGVWSNWVESSKLKVATPEELKKYTGKADLFARPIRITDPNDKSLYKELEIGKCTVSDFDLVWCIDSTGSMNQTNQEVAAETGVVVRLCSLISRRARCGVIYFRHETDGSLAKTCCQKAADNPKWYRVKGSPLTPDVKRLAAAMAAEPIPKPDSANEGNTHPGGAYHGALNAAMTQMSWSTDAKSRKVIVMVGDSMLTPGSEQACEKLTAEAKTKGFQVDALVKGKAIDIWSPAVKAGGGEIIPFTAGGGKGGGKKGARRGARLNADAANAIDDDPFLKLAARFVKESVPKDYHDRVVPLLGVLVPYAQAMADVDKVVPTEASK